MAIKEGLLAGECCLLLLQVLDERAGRLGSVRCVSRVNLGSRELDLKVGIGLGELRGLIGGDLRDELEIQSTSNLDEWSCFT